MREVFFGSQGSKRGNQQCFENSISMMEAFILIEDISGKRMNQVYSDNAKEGDHIVYYSDLA
jgi:hypothetical protein